MSIFYQQVFQFFIIYVSWLIVVAIFSYFMIFNYKAYLVTNTLILLIYTAWVTVLNQNFNSNNLIFWIFAIGGILALSALFAYEIRHASSIHKFLTLSSKGDFDKAKEIIDELLKSNFKHEITRFYKSMNLNCYGKTTEALALLNEILEENLPKNFEVLVMHYKFSLLLNFRSYGEAEDFLDIALEEYPSDHLIRLDGAELDRILGFKEDAEESYKNLLPLVEERLLKFRKSIITKIRLPETYWNNQLGSILFEKHRILYGLQEYENALEYVNEQLELNPESIDSLTSKISILIKLGQFEEALKYVEKSLELNSDYFYTLRNKGYILSKSGKPEDALEYFQQAIQINPELISSYYYEGQTHEDLEQYNEALKCFNKVLELNPDCELAEKAKEGINNKMLNGENRNKDISGV